MKADPQVGGLVQQAKGLLIVPHYFKAALLFGGQRGAGLMLIQQGGRWSDPVFYKTSNGSFGAQVGGASGALAMILMSDKAVETYTAKTGSWSFTWGAGLTAVHYSKDMSKAKAKSDVIIWTDNLGLFAGASIGAARVASDEHANQAYYNHTDVTPQQILSGLIANPYSNKLREELPMQQASR
jgi:lipid-binding SYLF domain-containing protein